MHAKRIIVLANSIKKGGRCVAGRLIDEAAVVAESWIRPISEEDEGTLLPVHMVVDNRRRLNVLDIVDLPIAAHAHDPCHPEDWIIGKSPWKFVRQFDRGGILALEDMPANLWLEDRAHSDRATCQFLRKQPGHQSLYLVRPQNLRVRLWKEFNQYKGYNQKKTRAVFNYRRVEYNLSLTDPMVCATHCVDFPEVGKPPREFPLPFGDHCLLCVSLTPKLRDSPYHYKVAATVLELP